MVLIRGLLALALFVGFMWGLRTFLYAMGEQFLYGFGCGMFFLFGLLWLHWKVTGKNIFTDA